MIINVTLSYARHSAFGDSFVSQRGKTIKEIFDNSNFQCLNDGSYTFKKNINDLSGSVLDLSFTNSILPIQWKTFKNMIGGSHHFPVILNINNTKCKGQTFLAKKQLMKKLSTIQLNTNFQEIHSVIKSEIKKSTYTLKGNKTPKVWWDSYVEKQYRLQIAAQKTYDMHSNDINARNLIKMIKNFKNAVQFAKKHNFMNKIQNLNKEPSSKHLFQFVRGCKNSLSSNSKSKWSPNNNKQFLCHLRDQVPDNNPINYVSKTTYNRSNLTMAKN